MGDIARLRDRGLPILVIAMLLATAVLSASLSLRVHGDTAQSIPDGLNIQGDEGMAAIVTANNWEGDGSASNPYIIENLNPMPYGIIVGGTSCHFIIRNCNIQTQGYEGINLYNVTNATIEHNTCNYMPWGIMMTFCSHCRVSNNTLEGDNWALNIDGSNNTIYGNTVLNCKLSGLNIYGSYNRVENNYIGSYPKVGISAEWVYYNIFSNNTISGEMDMGVSDSDNNRFENNTMSGGSIGMSLGRLNNNTLVDNVFLEHSSYAMNLQSSYNNTIFRNEFIANNQGDQIPITGPVSYDANRMQVYDDGLNRWNSTTMGNYWNDWLYPDDNHDGVVDEPNPIAGGNNTDHRPIADPYAQIGNNNSGPGLSVISPIDGQIIHSSAVEIGWSASNLSPIPVFGMQIDDGPWKNIGIVPSYNTNLSVGQHKVVIAAWDRISDRFVIGSVIFNLNYDVPSIPQNLTVTAEIGGVYLSWSPPNDGGSSITNYSIYRNGVLIGNSTNTYFMDFGAINGQPNTYNVTAWNLRGEGPSAQISFSGNTSSDNPLIIGTSIPWSLIGVVTLAIVVLGIGAILWKRTHIR